MASYSHFLKDNKNIEIHLANNFEEDKFNMPGMNEALMTNYVPKKVISDETRFTQCCTSLIQNVIDNSLTSEKNKINITSRYNSTKQQLYFEVEEYSKGMRLKDLY